MEYRAIRPSDIRTSPGNRETAPVKSNGKYKFRKRINRLEWDYQIKPLFINPDKVKQENNSYYGKMTILKKIEKNGKIEYVEKEINGEIDFSLNHPSFVCVEEKEDLEDAHRKVLNALSGR